jgi:LEA14-like dessication related protein
MAATAAAYRLTAMPRLRAIVAGLRVSSVAAICVLLLAACSGLPEKPLPPKVELAGVRVVSLQPSDLRLAVTLRIDNPNPFALDVAAIDAEIGVNGVRLAGAKLLEPASIAAASTTPVQLELRSRARDLAQVLERADGSGRMPYEITGTAVLGNGTALPFARRGELPVGDWLQGRPR